MKCKECGHEFGGNAKFCPECGKPTSSGINKVNCRKCNYELEGNLKFCPECGESVRSDNKGPRDINPINKDETSKAESVHVKLDESGHDDLKKEMLERLGEWVKPGIIKKETNENEGKGKYIDELNTWDKSKQVINIKTTLYVKAGQKEIEKSGFLGFGKKKDLVDDFAEKNVENRVEIRQNSLDMKFALIPAGEFMMGSIEDILSKPVPVHKVKINMPFYLGIYPVTQKEWITVMEINSSGFKGDDLPVEQVSWDDVQQFIKKLNEKEGINKYHLPSEAEWEYAVRAGTTTRYSFGDDESKLGDYAWYHNNSNGMTHPVGQKKPNSWGLYDMYGNVWEWVQDKWHDSYNGAPTDGSYWEIGGGSTRVYRGGSWGCDAGVFRSADRFDRRSDYSSRDLGFRLLRNL